MLDTINRNRWTVALGIVVVAVAAWAARAAFVEVPLDQQKLSDLGTHLATVVFAALVIERAVEVIVTNRYGPAEEQARAGLVQAQAEAGARKTALGEAVEMKLALTAPQKAWKDAHDALASTQAAAATALAAVKREKSHSSALLAVGFGLAAAVVGMRIFGPFIHGADGALIPAFAGDARTTQLAWFRAVDIVLSAVVLAGGADGIHKIIKAVRSGNGG